MHSICAGRIPTSPATARHCLVAPATSRRTSRARSRLIPKYPRHTFYQPDRAGALVEVDVGRKDSRLQISRRRVQIVRWQQRPAGSVPQQEPMVPKVVVNVRDQHVKRHATKQCDSVRLRCRSVASKRVHEFPIAAALSVGGTRHRQGRQEWNTSIADAIKVLLRPTPEYPDPPETHMATGFPCDLRAGSVDILTSADIRGGARHAPRCLRHQRNLPPLRGDNAFRSAILRCG